MSRKTGHIGAIVAAFAFFPGSFPAAAEPRAVWPDAFLSRVELLALMQTLNASLLASRSATATLENWCASHKMSAAPKIVARLVSGAQKAASEETRQRLRVESPGEIKYRRVELSCGGHVLSEADNWYVPGRLSPKMNRLLETTDTPFGKAVQALQPFRRTFETKTRWSPLPEGWELRAPERDAGKGQGEVAIPHEIFEHRAILYGADQTPFSEVHETYTKEIFDFDAKASR